MKIKLHWPFIENKNGIKSIIKFSIMIYLKFKNSNFYYIKYLHIGDGENWRWWKILKLYDSLSNKNIDNIGIVQLCL